MVARIEWTDDFIGAAVLSNLKPAPGDRFDKWTPLARPIGAFAHRLGSGQRDGFIFRRDNGVSFELSKIPNTEQEAMARLSRHLQVGGRVTLFTGDPGGRTYPNCQLWPDTTIERLAEHRAPGDAAAQRGFRAEAVASAAALLDTDDGAAWSRVATALERQGRLTGAEVAALVAGAP